MTVKKYLADLYLTGAGSNSDPEKLIRKIKYYQEFLDVIGKVDRGYPPWRGQVLFEMHRPMMVKANRDYESGDISKEEFLNTLRKISCQLEESIKCLQPEAEGTKEAYQAKLANKALKGIKELIFFSDFL